MLTPCPRCRRHVRVSELACPFCVGVAVVAGAALTLSGCDVAATAAAQVDDGTGDPVRMTPQYGAPSYDPEPPPPPPPSGPANRDAGPNAPRAGS